MQSNEKLLTTAEASERLGLGRSTLEKLRCSGKGPKFHKLAYAVRYAESDLAAWLKDRQRSSTSQNKFVPLSRANT
ncbi:hypothetical protein sos41_02480 [Alphaproteobacteria bacterium SO-S41]|nr:hypothetical protein sos41_02480 [Alphaproteobacteria bacterium SO-S41]